MNSYISIGCMSGTSLDGLDLAACRFTFDRVWNYEILKSVTIPYSRKWINRLVRASELSSSDFAQLNNDYGKFIGRHVSEFCSELPDRPDMVSSHGHTIFHQPENKLTVQIGHGASIAATCGILTACDFRSTDLALNGQGAPLVPVGDELLFGEYDFCLNIGGIANISFREDNERRAFDICPANMAFNHIINDLGFEYDLDGHLGRTGVISEELLTLLNDLDYYRQKGPKSLGREWFESEFLPLIHSFQLDARDALRTLYEHVSDQLSFSIEGFPKGQILLTGGGAHNVFLLELFSEKTKHKTIIPSAQLIDFKEAVVFAFLGVLRLREETNCLRSVTGADRNHCGGALYLA